LFSVIECHIVTGTGLFFALAAAPIGKAGAVGTLEVGDFVVPVLPPLAEP
jgi:hypothetical protein